MLAKHGRYIAGVEPTKGREMTFRGGGMDELFEGLVREGMARMRWSRKRAEQAAKLYLKRTENTEKAKRMLGVVVPPRPDKKPAPTLRVVKASEATASKSKPLDWEELLALNAAAKKRRELKAKQGPKTKSSKPPKAKKKPKAKKAQRPELVGDLAAAMPKPSRSKKKRITSRNTRRSFGQ